MTVKITELTAGLWADMVQSGCALLGNNKEAVNALNVFPVPDGDTGINMYLTVGSAVKNIQGRGGKGVGEIAGDFAMGALMGARGNSGVILSQMFRGFSQSLIGKTTVDARAWAAALQRGVDLSYKSVMKPVEGTMLTVFKAYAAGAVKAAEDSDDMIAVLTAAEASGLKMLAETQYMLPALTEAGVVDAGGKGLLYFLAGCLLSLQGQPVVAADGSVPVATGAMPEFKGEQNIEFTYCTQLLIKGSELPVEKIRKHLSKTPPGDSLLVVGDENVIKIHFHNNHPGQVLEYCSGFGSIHDIIIDNMRDQHHQNMLEQAANGAAAAPALSVAAAAEKPARAGVIAVCSGEGMRAVFESLGAKVISGGQTMNPSAEDLVNAVNQSPAAEVILLPNNSNIILTAQQAKKLTKKPVQVVETKYITQGIAAMLPFNCEDSAGDNAVAMGEAFQDIVSGELTFAVRPAKYNGFEIATGDILGLKNGKIVGCGQDIRETLLDLLHKMLDDVPDSSLISLFYGNDLPPQEAQAIFEQVQQIFPNHEVEMHIGGQPLYYFLISVE